MINDCNALSVLVCSSMLPAEILKHACKWRASSTEERKMLMTSFATFCPKMSEDEQERVKLLLACEEMYEAIPGNSRASFAAWRVNEPLTSGVAAQRFLKALNVDGHHATCRFFPEVDLLLVMVKPPPATSVANPPCTDNMLAYSSVRWNFIDFCKMPKQISPAPVVPNTKNKCFVISDRELGSMSTRHEVFPYLGALLQRSATGLPSCQSHTLRFNVDGMVMVLQASKPKGWDGTAFTEAARVSFACEFDDGIRISYNNGQPLYCTDNNTTVHHQWTTTSVDEPEGEIEGEEEATVEVLEGVWIHQLHGPNAPINSVATSYVTPQGDTVQWLVDGTIRMLQGDGTLALVQNPKGDHLVHVHVCVCVVNHARWEDQWLGFLLRFASHRKNTETSIYVLKCVYLLY